MLLTWLDSAPGTGTSRPQESRAALAAAEARAAEAAKAGAARRLKEAEARVETLEGTLAELRAELERQVGGRGLGLGLSWG